MPGADFPIHPNQSARFGTNAGVRLREDSAYTDAKGEESKGIRKRADEALTKLQETLRKVLEPEEAVLFLARARERLSTLEQLFLGWHAIFASDSLLLVFTNRRLLQVRVKMNGQWAQGVRGARWGDIKEAKIKGLSAKMLYLTYLDGKKEAFWQIRNDDGKKIDLLVKTLLPAATGESSSAQGAVSLCPSCFRALTPDVFECPQCHQAFKDKSTLTRRAWLIPGGAYFYTGHTFLGVMGFIGEGFLLLLAIATVIAAAAGAPGLFDEANGPPSSLGENLFVSAFILALVVLMKYVGLTHGRRAVGRFIPAA